MSLNGRREVNNSLYPEHNCVAEWKNCTVVESARNILQGKELANQFGAELVAASIYFLNLSVPKAL